MIDPGRVSVLVEGPPKMAGRYVLYWMQQSQRTRGNHALQHAIDWANRLGRPVVVCFGLMDGYPEANARHYAFMLEGLRDVERNLRGRGIKFVVRRGKPAEVALHYAQDAAMVVCDRGYLRHQKAWRAEVAAGCGAAGRPVAVVESDSVVPVGIASNKREYAARTIRPRIHRHLAEFLRPLKESDPEVSSLRMRIEGDLEVGDPASALAGLRVNSAVRPVGRWFSGGEEEARRRLLAFAGGALAGYDQGRNEPAADGTSHLSAYLHFGQISPLEIALRVRDAAAPAADRKAYLEELIVRRELANNYCDYTEHYDSYDALPGWAKQTLKDHAGDTRATVYTIEELERAQTHDVCWNAAQRQMNVTGFMHNYMRMYWGKKILEWTADPRDAFATTLKLNNKLFLCGRDPVSYASVAWIYGLHDRPWGPARKIFGTVRYMNEAGLRRKFDMDGYVKAMALLDEAADG